MLDGRWLYVAAIPRVLLNSLGIVIGWTLSRFAIAIRERHLSPDRSAV